MITIQFDDGKAHFSEISYLEDGGTEKRIRVPLGKGKEVYLVIKREDATLEACSDE